jgi:hypothetical protein
LYFALVLTTPARAQQLTPGNLQLEARAAILEAALKDVQRPTRLYFGGWLAALSAMAVGQAALTPLVDNSAQRASLWLGAGLSTAGVGLLLITPFPGRYAADEVAGMATRTPAERRAKLSRAELLLEREAKSAWFQRAWFQHVFTALLGGGVILGLGLLYPDDLWTAAIPSGIGTFLTAEAQIWTRPRRAIDHWQRYRTAPVLSLAPLIAPNTLGLGVGGKF